MPDVVGERGARLWWIAAGVMGGIAVLAGVAFGVPSLLYTAYRIPGVAMEPTSRAPTT